jgi:hypothetical protein
VRFHDRETSFGVIRRETLPWPPRRRMRFTDDILGFGVSL